MAPGRMSNRYDLPGIEIIASGNGLQIVGCLSDVEQGAGPTSTDIPNATILDIPGSYPLSCQIFGQGRHQRKVISSSPEATVNKYDNGMRAGAFRSVKLTKLEWV